MSKPRHTETKGSSNGSDADTTQRSVLPIPERGLDVYDFKCGSSEHVDRTAYRMERCPSG